MGEEDEEVFKSTCRGCMTNKILIYLVARDRNAHRDACQCSLVDRISITSS